MSDMGAYGRAAIDAARSCGRSENGCPKIAWADAVEKEFPRDKCKDSSREKSCPRGAFLGLCEKGFVVGIKRVPDSDRRPNVNADYAVDAVTLLWRDASLADSTPMELWREVLRSLPVEQPRPKTHNKQMHVVLSLWREQLIRCSGEEVA